MKKPMTIIMLLFVLVFLASLVSAQIRPDYELNIAKGISKLNSKEYGDAIAIFNDILKSYPDDPKAMQMLGIAQSRNGMLKEAEETLQRVAEKQYEPARTYYELGIIKYKQSEYKTAKEYFSRAEQKSEDTSLNESIKAYKSDIEKREGLKRYNIAATLGFQYDSNVPLESAERSGGWDRREDVRAVVNLKGDLTLTSSPVRTVVGYSFYQSLHYHLSSFNVQNHKFDIRAEYKPIDKVALEGKYIFDYTYVGEDAFSRVHTIMPSVRLMFIKNAPTRLVYAYSKKSFFTTEDFNQNRDRGSNNNMLGVEQTIPIIKNLFLNLAYYYDRNKALERAYTYHGNKYSGQLYYDHNKKWSASAKAEYYDKGYKGKTEWNDPPWILHSKIRDDITRTYSFTFRKPITPNLSVSVDQTFINNSSSIPFYSYERAVTSLFLTVRF